MRLLELSSIVIDDVMRKVRRFAVVGAILVVCGLVVAIEGISAARLALEPAVGSVWSRLIIAGAFALLAAGAIAAFIWTDRSASRAQAARDAHGEDPRAAIIAEAISLGYSLGRDFMKATPQADEPPAEDADPARARASGAADPEERRSAA